MEKGGPGSKEAPEVKPAFPPKCGKYDDIELNDVV
jgi:hypothetical protein